jgi:hypothetical protein
MEITRNLSSNPMRKIGLLITKAAELGMDVGGYGFADENQMSGNVYLWLEDYPFTLFIGLGSDDIQALWTNSNDGEEVEISVGDMNLYGLCQWVNGLEASMEEV